jgi:hypothetical protein
LVVTSKRVDGFEETGGVGVNKDTRDRDCADVSARGGHFFHVPKDWDVKLGVVRDVFFQSFKKIKGFGVFWELLEMPLVVNISCCIKQDNAYYAYS